MLWRDRRISTNPANRHLAALHYFQSFDFCRGEPEERFQMNSDGDGEYESSKGSACGVAFFGADSRVAAVF